MPRAKASPRKAKPRATPKPRPKRVKTQRLEDAARRRAGETVPLKRAPVPYRDGEPSSGPQPLEHCPACDEFKLLNEFALRPQEKMNARGCFVCQSCRDTAKKPPTNALARVSPRDRQMLRDLIRTQSYAETARLHGVSSDTIRSRTYKAHPTDGFNAQARREAYQQLLVSEGLDAGTISRLMKLEIYAVEPKWNSAKGDWDYFPDHKSRQSAMRWLNHILGLNPATASSKAEAPSLSVTISNNLGAEGKSRGDDGADRFTIDITPDADA